jgi:hypothetical protein
MFNKLALWEKNVFEVRQYPWCKQSHCGQVQAANVITEDKAGKKCAKSAF